MVQDWPLKKPNPDSAPQDAVDDDVSDALRRIAKGTLVNASGNAQSIPRADLINIARDACYAAGIIWCKAPPPGGFPGPSLLKLGDKNV